MPRSSGENDPRQQAMLVALDELRRVEAERLRRDQEEQRRHAEEDRLRAAAAARLAAEHAHEQAEARAAADAALRRAEAARTVASFVPPPDDAPDAPSSVDGGAAVLDASFVRPRWMRAAAFVAIAAFAAAAGATALALAHTVSLSVTNTLPEPAVAAPVRTTLPWRGFIVVPLERAAATKRGVAAARTDEPAAVRAVTVVRPAGTDATRRGPADAPPAPVDCRRSHDPMCGVDSSGKR
jgi:hypothetical protein